MSLYIRLLFAELQCVRSSSLVARIEKTGEGPPTRKPSPQPQRAVKHNEAISFTFMEIFALLKCTAIICPVSRCQRAEPRDPAALTEALHKCSPQVSESQIDLRCSSQATTVIQSPSIQRSNPLIPHFRPGKPPFGPFFFPPDKLPNGTPFNVPSTWLETFSLLAT